MWTNGGLVLTMGHLRESLTPPINFREKNPKTLRSEMQALPVLLAPLTERVTTRPPTGSPSWACTKTPWPVDGLGTCKPACPSSPARGVSVLQGGTQPKQAHFPISPQSTQAWPRLGDWLGLAVSPAGCAPGAQPQAERNLVPGGEMDQGGAEPTRSSPTPGGRRASHPRTSAQATEGLWGAERNPRAAHSKA